MTRKDTVERTHVLLKTLVECYIRDGQPVGSKTLVEESSLTVSSATVRKIMSDLEDRGYIVSPHTSAGRVPTEMGFRLFVDTLAVFDRPRLSDVAVLQQRLEQQQSTEELITVASSLLSETTQMAGLVMLPQQNQFKLRQVEFLALSERRVLVVLVINEKEVQNRIIHTEREYSEVELKQATNYINQVFAGHDLAQIRQQLLSKMEEDKTVLGELMQTAMDVAEKTFHSEAQQGADYVLSGETHLLDIAEAHGDVSRLREVFEAFNQKRDVLHLLDRCIGAQGTRIFIGAESGCSAFADCSVVAAPYEVGGEVLGVLAVVGPTRMNYQMVVPSVDITAKILGLALNQVS